MNSSNFSGSLIIHVGPHKTGTTTIQSYLNDNAKLLQERSVLYPEAGRGHQAPNQHWEFGRAILESDADYLGRFTQSIERELEQSKAKTLILSTEVLSRKNITSAQLSLITTMFPKAERNWVILLRQQDSLIASFYAEHIKKGLLAFPSDAEKVTRPELLDHLRRINLVANAAERDRIIVGSFEKMKTSLIEDFMKMINLEHCYVREREAVSAKNQAMPENVLSLIRLVNALPRPISHKLRERLVTWFNQPPNGRGAVNKVSKKVLLYKELARPYAAGNAAIEQMFFAGRDIGLFKDAKDSDVAYLVKSHDHLCSRVSGWLPGISLSPNVGAERI